MEYHHVPVLLDEVITHLHIKNGHKYIDATLGGAGHSIEILKLGGILLGIDQDSEAVEFVRRKWKVESEELKVKEETLRVVQGNFSDIKEIANKNGFEKVAGILFDLGFSSFQMDASGRGFSFLRDEELDMRMDKEGKITAKDILNNYSEAELGDLFERLGEEEKGKQIARVIAEKRKGKQIATTQELAHLVMEVVRRQGDMHPATKVFQALRIEVNDELTSIQKGLNQSLDLLESGGRLAVISFHSLEDRIVKRMFQESSRTGGYAVITRKPIVAGYEEIQRNRRARSAKLRILEKK